MKNIFSISPSLKQYRYLWPGFQIKDDPRWKPVEDKPFYARHMPENKEELTADSRWPAFFPAPICFVTTTNGSSVALEKVVGSLIVNRFPYVMAISFCKQRLSERHHPRARFIKMLESDGAVAVQFFPPGGALNKAMYAINSTSEEETTGRIAKSELGIHKAVSNDAPIFNDAYMVYEARLVKSGKDLEGREIYPEPWIDAGSHRIYFLEINAIQLRSDIAEGRSRIAWRSLPHWQPKLNIHSPELTTERIVKSRYQKEYTPYYLFPSSGTIAFDVDRIEDSMAIKFMPPSIENQIKIDNDAARWPCFFPSTVGMITSYRDDGQPNLMPCSSTSILGRYPLTIAACICYADINERYSPRASLKIIRQSGKFGCGVPFIDETVVNAIKYAGSVSIFDDLNKIAHSGLAVEKGNHAPILSALPIHFDCKVIKEVRLGTHIMFLGEVIRILIRRDITSDNPLEWYPWPDVISGTN